MGSMDTPNLPAFRATTDKFFRYNYYFVVVGGTAGLVVVAHLTENLSSRVGVLEAGPCQYRRFNDCDTGDDHQTDGNSTI